jgi:flagellar protein FliO/FliZ
MEGALVIKALSAFVFVISFMLLLAWGIRKAGFSNSVMLTGARRRLKIVEFLSLDHRRKLVLVRRDNKDHLLVLGPNGETVVEAGIPVAEEAVVTLKEVNNAHQ